MRKNLFTWALIIPALLLFMACRPDIESCFDLVTPPPAIALRITVNNQASATATVKIRHAWTFSEAGTDWVLSGWGELVTVGPGESQRLGNETARYQYKNKDQEMSGFILWQESAAEQFELLAGKSSFELEIALGGRTTRLAGYPPKESGFAKTELSWLNIKCLDDFGSERTALLWSEGNGVYMTTDPYSIPATLTINANGTYSFQFDEDMHWHITAVW